jgi:hypothetical protein
MLLAVLDTDASDLLVDAKFQLSFIAMPGPVLYLRDYTEEAGSWLCSELDKVGLSNAVADSGSEYSSSPTCPPKRRRLSEDVARAFAKVGSLDDSWRPFSNAVSHTFQHGLSTSLVGLLILHGGTAVLPLADKLLNAGFKLQLEAQDSCPLLVSVVDHFIRRCWVENQLELPSTRAMDALRRALL